MAKQIVTDKMDEEENLKLQCHDCEKEFTATQLAMDSTTYYIITSMFKNGIRWHCQECLSNENSQDPLQKQIQKLSQQMTSMTTQITKIAQVQEKMEKSNTNTTNAAETPSTSAASSMPIWVETGKQKMDMITNLAKEVLNNQKQLSVERDEREKNVILFGINEKDNTENLDEDNQFLKTMCENALDFQEVPEVKVTRISTKKLNKIRPIKAEFTNIWHKRKFLSSLWKLKDKEQYKHVRVSHDMCIADREENRKLLQEAYKRNQEETPTTFKYKVRGPPWAMKITKVSLAKN